MTAEAPFRLPGVQKTQRAARPLRFPLPETPELKQLNITLRPETPDDIPFLTQLYARSRSAEMLMLDTWDGDMKKDFLEKQFSYQYLHHSRYYANADFTVITMAGRPIGRIYLFWDNDGGRDCRLFEFQIIPTVRNRGIGSALLSALLRQAQTLKRSVSLHVEPINGARRLYSRFGFLPVGTEAQSGSMMMRWNDGPVEQGLRLAI